MHIVIIDNNISSICNHELSNNIRINSRNEAEPNNKISEALYSHGTLCYLLLKAFFEDADVSSVEILDEEGRGSIEKLSAALKWCDENHADAVNLSFGSANFTDIPYIRKLVNHYSNKGMVFISAGSNSGLAAYPSKFSQVMGISSETPHTDETIIKFQLNIHTGIDAYVGTHNIISREGIPEFELPQSNSYSAPYITAMISKLLINNQLNIFEIKTAFRKLYGSYHSFCCDQLFDPDWIECAVYVDGCLPATNAETYYTMEGEITENTDTLIIEHLETLVLYRNSKYKIIYMGEEECALRGTEWNNFFWRPKCRECQIEYSLDFDENAGEIAVPIVFIEYTHDIDELYLLQQLKNRFAKESYHMYAASFMKQSILYDIDYIPNKYVENREEYQKLKKFLYYEAYYKQYDLFLLAGPIDTVENTVLQEEEADIRIYIQAENLRLVDWDSKQEINLSYKDMNTSIIDELYDTIVKMFSGEC